MKQLGQGRSESEEFVFMLKNPHGFPTRKFALKAEKQDRAIFCDSSCGPRFGDIGIFDDCNAFGSGSELGGSCANDTGLRGDAVLTGSSWFRVREIEVFETAD
jgi:hypothetical protein